MKFFLYTSIKRRIIDRNVFQMADPRLVIRVESSAPAATYISFGPAEEDQVLSDGRTAFFIPIFVTVHLEELDSMEAGAVIRMTRAQTDLTLPRIGNERARLEEYEEEEEGLSTSKTSTEGQDSTSAGTSVEELVEDLVEINLQEKWINHRKRGHLEEMEQAIPYTLNPCLRQTQ